MKAKSKVLLGLIVALAMVVFAVPAFAASDYTVTPSTPKTVYIGDTPTEATFTLTMSGAAATDKFQDVTFEDITAGKADTFKIVDSEITTTYEPENKTGANVVASVKITLAAAATVKKGDHTLRYTVDNGNEKSGNVTVTVAELPTASLTGATDDAAPTLAKTVNAGNAIGLNAVVPTGTEATYQWEITKEKVEAAPEEDSDWENIPGATQSTLNTEAATDMDGKFVRCAVTVGDKTVYAAGSNNAKPTAVKLTVKNPTEIVVEVKDEDDKAAKSSYTYFVGEKAETLTASATGGPDEGGDYKFIWQKDGEDLTTESNPILNLNNVKATDAGTYKCVVTKGEGTAKVTGESAEITIEVEDTPTLEIEEATGKAAYYDNTLAANPGEGVINLEADKIGKALTLTAAVEGLDYDWIEWYKGEDVIRSASGKGSYTVPAAEVVNDAKYTVKVGFDETHEQIAAPLVYTATIKEVSGELSGGVITSKDGLKTAPDNNPTYTITLPAGYNFAVDNEKTDLAKYGVEVTPTITGGKITVTKEPVAITKASDKATLEFKYTTLPSGATALTEPLVENMVVTVADTVNVEDVTDIKDVNLPVTEENGYNITLAAKGWDVSGADLVQGQIAMTAPEPTDDDFVAAVNYTGKAVEATVEAADEVEGLGEISNIRYQKVTEGEEPDSSKATKKAPQDAGLYYVFCDIADGEQWGGAKDQLAGAIVIAPLDLTDPDSVKAEDVPKYFKIDPESKVYNGENQEPEVTFADGVEKAGEISKVTYKLAGTNTEVTPLNVGKYDVYVETKTTTDGDENGYNIVPTTSGKAHVKGAVKVGTFEITKVAPTADLYEMKPTEVTYTGAEQEPAIVKADDKAGDVAKVIYYAEGSEEALEGAPVDPGVYTVTIETKESDTYAAATGEDALELGTFTIKKDASEQPTIYTVGHVENIGWGSDGKGKLEELKPGGTVDMGTTGQGLRVEAMAFIVPEDYKVIGFAHVENEGDVAVKEVKSSKDYEIPAGYVAYEFGSTGKGQRVEAVCIGLQDASGEYVKGFQYAVHLQNYGWQGFVRNGSFSGTRGMGLRMESIRFTYSEDDIVKAGTPEKDS